MRGQAVEGLCSEAGGCYNDEPFYLPVGDKVDPNVAKAKEHWQNTANAARADIDNAVGAGTVGGIMVGVGVTIGLSGGGAGGGAAGAAAICVTVTAGVCGALIVGGGVILLGSVLAVSYFWGQKYEAQEHGAY